MHPGPVQSKADFSPSPCSLQGFDALYAAWMLPILANPKFSQQTNDTQQENL